MEKEKAVTNTNSLIFIAKISIFHLAKNMFSEIFITEEVLDEILEKESQENMNIENELNGFLKKVNVREMKQLNLDKGETSAISYCLENNINTFLSDDKEARAKSESLGLKSKGVLAILLWNLQKDFINKEECKRLFNELIRNDLYISSDLYSRMLELIEEY